MITPRRYLKYNVQTLREIENYEYSFVDNYEIPKKLPQQDESTLRNTFNLGDVQSACFARTPDKVVHLFIGTTRGKFIDFLPEQNRIIRIVELSQTKSIDQICYMRDMAICLSRSGLYLIKNDSLKYEKVKVPNATKFFPAKSYSSTLETSVALQVLIDAKYDCLGLVQTDDSIFLVHTGQSQANESVESIVTYEVKFLFHN